MKDEPFQSLDETWMKKFQPLREKKVPHEILEGFSASVESRILERQLLKSHRPAWIRWSPVLVPAFAVLLLAVSTVVIRSSTVFLPVKGTATISLAVPVASEIPEEVALLIELGEWTELDEAELS